MRRLFIVGCILLVASTAGAVVLPAAMRAKNARGSKEPTKVKVRRIEQVKPTSTTAPPPKTALTGTHRIFVVLVETDDAKFKDAGAKARIDKLFFGSDSPSVSGFYAENSYGLYQLEGAVVGPVRVPGTLKSFSYAQGSDGADVRKLVTAALEGAADQIDMERFDTHDQFGRAKADGIVDHFAVIFPNDRAGTDGYFKPIWPHRGTIEAAAKGRKLASYYVFSDSVPVGTIAHEHGHDIGMPDLYDRDDSSYGTGDWCTMGSGSWLGQGNLPGHMSAWGKMKMGWIRPKIMAKSEKRVEIPAVETTPFVVKVPVGAVDGPEYYLVENRQKLGFDADLPDDGLLIWHVDESMKDNDDENHKLVDVVQQGGVQDLDAMYKDKEPAYADTFKAGRKTRFADDTKPSAKSYAGAATGIAISEISASKGVMTADFDVPTLTVPDGEPFVIVEDNYQFGSFGFVPLPKGSEELVELTATPGAFDVQEVEALLISTKPGPIDVTVTFYADEGGKPGRKLKELDARATVKANTDAWLKARLGEPLRLKGEEKFWVGVRHDRDQVGVAYNPDSVSKHARFRQGKDKGLKAAFNFASGKEPVPDFILRVHGYGFIGVADPAIPAQADEGDELVKRMREGDKLLDDKKFLEAQAIYETILPRMIKDSERFSSWIPVVQNAIGVAAYQAGAYGVAVNFFETSLRRAERAGDTRAQADILENIGETLFLTKAYDDARTHCRRAYDLNQDTADRLLESTYWLGRIAVAQGNDAEAATYLDQAASLVDKVVASDTVTVAKWQARLERARAGTALGEDSIDGESHVTAALMEERKVEDKKTPETAPAGDDGNQVDMSDYGLSP